MGDDPTYIAGAGELHARVSAKDHWESAAERGGWEMDLSSSEGGHARGGVRRYPEGRHKEAEYGRVIHCDATNSGPL